MGSTHAYKHKYGDQQYNLNHVYYNIDAYRKYLCVSKNEYLVYEEHTRDFLKETLGMGRNMYSAQFNPKMINAEYKNVLAK